MICIIDARQWGVIDAYALKMNIQPMYEQLIDRYCGVDVFVAYDVTCSFTIVIVLHNLLLNFAFCCSTRERRSWISLI